MAVRELPRDERCAATARRFVAQQLYGEVGGEALSNAMLVASELATNAYRHGEGRIELRVARTGERIRIEVADNGVGVLVEPRTEPGDHTGGWGLRVVEELASDWGASGGTTNVWAELRLG
jgi:anti-sigma regulatory factor (Ser/Thr protein kinase)